jgi:hypothetical protein
MLYVSQKYDTLSIGGSQISEGPVNPSVNLRRNIYAAERKFVFNSDM